MDRKTGVAIALIIVSITASSVFCFLYLSRGGGHQEGNQWRIWAEIAWRYYTPGVGVDPDTLLHRANIHWHRFTDWDLGSHIQSLIDADKIGLIRTGPGFSERINRILEFLERRELSPNGVPHWSYSSSDGKPNRESGETPPADTGRLLVALAALRAYKPEMAKRIETAVNRQNFRKVLALRGFEGGFYGYFAAQGFKAFGIDHNGLVAASLKEMSNLSKGKFVEIFGEQIPLAWITSEPVLHTLLEVASLEEPFREYSARIYRVQEKRFMLQGKYTAFSEGAYFAHGNYIFEWIIRGDTGAMWTVTRIDEKGVHTLDIAPVVYTKAVLGFHAVFSSEYTKKLVEWLLSYREVVTVNGFAEGVTEANELVAQPTDKTNAMILSAANYAIEKSHKSARSLQSNTAHGGFSPSVAMTLPIQIVGHMSAISQSWLKMVSTSSRVESFVD